ncbi:response regulator transcription factor [Serratia sp. 22264]|uniref:response regulator transcription factor n=1 Tax=Serratia sp. 22264 TaxID=3453897 RepID=UPI003F85A570
MKTHIISDDTFFALGCERIFHVNAYSINIIMANQSCSIEISEKIGSDDIVLVAMGSHLRTQKVLERLSCIGAEAILFIDMPKKTVRELTWIYGFMSKKMPIEQLIPSFNSISRQPGNKAKLLSKREKQVMDELLKGISFKDISESMKISLKTVYAHRRNALKKIGLRHANSFSYVGYQNYIANSSIKLISY